MNDSSVEDVTTQNWRRKEDKRLLQVLNIVYLYARVKRLRILYIKVKFQLSFLLS